MKRFLFCALFLGVAAAAVLFGGCSAGTGGTADGADPYPSDVPIMGAPVPKPVATGCVTDLTAGHRVVSCDSVAYNLTVPDKCLAESCGVIVDVHGGTMSADMEDKSTQLAEIAPDYGFIVVQPSSPDGLWDFATDDTKILSFIADTTAAFHTDPKHLHVTGISQGGYMSWRFLCQHTDLFASAAPAAAAGTTHITVEVGCTFTGTDVPGDEIDILYMHGTEDGLVDFANGTTLRDAVIAFWKMDAGELIASDETYKRTRYKTAKGHVFEFLQHDYTTDSSFLGVAIKGHCFPGSPDQSITLPNQIMSFGCKPPNSFTWGRELLHFFLTHPKT